MGMPGERLSMRKIREVLRLRFSGAKPAGDRDQYAAEDRERCESTSLVPSAPTHSYDARCRRVAAGRGSSRRLSIVDPHLGFGGVGPGSRRRGNIGGRSGHIQGAARGPAWCRHEICRRRVWLARGSSTIPRRLTAILQHHYTCSCSLIASTFGQITLKSSVRATQSALSFGALSG